MWIGKIVVGWSARTLDSVILERLELVAELVKLDTMTAFKGRSEMNRSNEQE